MYLKTFDQALVELGRSVRADLGQDVDLIEGSVTRSLLEAISFQTADLSERQERSVLDAIPQAVFNALGFSQLPASPARGNLVFSAPVPAGDVVFIPSGTQAISDDEQVFATTQDAYLSAGQLSVVVPAVALAGGAASNVQALGVVRLGTGVPGIQSVTNPAPFSGGQDAETLEAQRGRLVGYLTELDQSNPSAMMVALRRARFTGSDGIETQLDNALVLDAVDAPRVFPGTLEVHLYRLGGVSEGLRAACEAAVHRARSGGCIPTIIVTTGTPVDVTLKVDGPSAAVARAQVALSAYFASLDYGQKASYENIIKVASNADASIKEVRLIAPAADVPCEQTQRLEAGVLSVTGGV